jgi:hypothetical protein
MSAVAEKKKVKDLTVNEFKSLIQETIAEDMGAWKDTLEILADKTLMKQILGAENARKAGKKSDFVSWEKLKQNV